ncbi:hypothetical protein [Salinibacter ruber]|nr:hypothetical protein [Salinibacter ruber]MCS3661801.1 hypothetical protein [Salinibacter ruber]
MGIRGWRQGLKGPLTKSEAQNIQAQIGAEIIPVEVEDFDGLILKAFEKVGIDPPEDLIEEFASEESGSEAADTVSEETRQKEEEIRELLDEHDEEEATQALEHAIELLSEEPTEASKVGSPEQEESLEDTIQPEKAAAEDREEDGPGPEWPGYNEAIEIMNDHGFDWMEAGGGRKTANVKDAWEEFGSQFK